MPPLLKLLYREKQNLKKCISNFYSSNSKGMPPLRQITCFIHQKAYFSQGQSIQVCSQVERFVFFVQQYQQHVKNTGLLLLLIVSVSSLSLNHLAAFPTGKVNIKADTNMYLARCHSCGASSPQTPDSASISTYNYDGLSAIWTVESVGGGKVAFKADSGKYLARCNGCWLSASSLNGAFVHSTSSARPQAQWTPQDLGNGKWALKSDDGNYLARCHYCVGYTLVFDFAFVNANSPKDPSAQWTITKK